MNVSTPTSKDIPDTPILRSLIFPIIREHGLRGISDLSTSKLSWRFYLRTFIRTFILAGILVFFEFLLFSDSDSPVLASFRQLLSADEDLFRIVGAVIFLVIAGVSYLLIPYFICPVHSLLDFFRKSVFAMAFVVGGAVGFLSGIALCITLKDNPALNGFVGVSIVGVAALLGIVVLASILIALEEKNHILIATEWIERYHKTQAAEQVVPPNGP